MPCKKKMNKLMDEKKGNRSERKGKNAPKNPKKKK
jgi:hypothetical protein